MKKIYKSQFQSPIVLLLIYFQRLEYSRLKPNIWTQCYFLIKVIIQRRLMASAQVLKVKTSKFVSAAKMKYAWTVWINYESVSHFRIIVSLCFSRWKVILRNSNFILVPKVEWLVYSFAKIPFRIFCRKRFD
mgnify:CR=1 FL=1